MHLRGMDAAYGTGPRPGWLVAHKIAPHSPVFDRSNRIDGIWSRADIEWNVENDLYIWPEGQALQQVRRTCCDPNRGPTGEGRAKYRALKLTCRTCPALQKFCPNADAGSITREAREDAGQIRDERAIRHLHGAPEDNRDAVCPSRTHPRPGAPPMTWPLSGSWPYHDPSGQGMRCK